LENGIVEEVASESVTSFFQHALEAGAFVLWPPLPSLIPSLPGDPSLGEN
jgi:hypothetical protein